MYHLTTGNVLRNASLGDFIIVRTSQTASTQTYVIQPIAHVGCVLQSIAPGPQACTARYSTKQHEMTSSTRENDTHRHGEHKCEAAASVTWQAVLQQIFL